MSSGEVTGYIDVAQLVLYAFWIFFAGLIYYLHQENKREGYPLTSDRTERAPRVVVQGFPPIPAPKTFKLAHGGEVQVPNRKADTREIKAKPIGPWLGAPLEPTGNPMVDGVGPAAYAERSDTPDLTFDGRPRIVPLSTVPHQHVAEEDADPHGMEVLGADGVVAGTVKDLWVDQSEEAVRYLEVTLAGSGKNVLLPINFTRINGGRRRVLVNAILAHQFAQVPTIRVADRVTLLEEDKIMGYYGGGTLYAEPSRAEPLI